MRRSLIPFAVLASCLALSGAATWSVRANEDAVVERRFEALILGARGRIVAALDGDLAMLRAAAVIVAASGRIDRRLFQSYVARAGLLRSSGRLESVGFLESDGRESRREVAGPCIERACQEALAIARDAGDLRLSAPLEAGRFAAIVPVYGATDGPREPVGFIYGVFRVAELGTSVLPS